jgi:hypothetical protein
MPDMTLPMPQPALLPPGQMALDHEVVMPLGDAAGKWIGAVDLRPGAPSIVRRAQLLLRSSGAADATVGLWVPGEVPQVLAADAAFRIPTNASLVMRVHYQQPTDRSVAIEDRSTVGLYFSRSAAPRPLQTLEIGDAGAVAFQSSRVITRRIAGDTHLVSVRPITGPPGATARIVIVDAKGLRTPIMRVQFRSEWPRRYALAMPVRIPRGSVVELTVTASQAALWETLTGDRPVDAAGSPLRIALETVAP